MTLKNICRFFFLFFSIFFYGQEEDSSFNLINTYYKKENYQTTIKIGKEKIKSLNYKNKCHIQYLIGKSYENLNQEDSAFIYYQKALKNFKKLNQLNKIAEINLSIYLLLDSQEKLSINKDIYFDSFYDYVKKSKSKKLLASAYNCLGVRNINHTNTNIPKQYFIESYRLYKEIESIDFQIQILSNLGVLYKQKIKKLDSAKIYYNKALFLFDSDSSKNKNLNTKFNLYNNLGNVYKKNKEYKKAIKFFKNAELLGIKKYKLKSKKKLYSNIEASYYYLKDFEKAYHYLYKYDSIKDVINLKDQNAHISDIQEQYDNEKLRADNLEIESKRKQNLNLLIASIAFILFGGITAFLLQKNTKRKQKLAERNKELETQKLVAVLKDQELASIDAMIAGQEKERQRIANDLHDDLGGLMATIKLHFNAFKDKQTPELSNKTTALLDEAYQKVRSIAHAKNSGVIANEGLLKAIQNMANTISFSNQININVIDHGLEERLENSLELTIFRIIQELTANIIKHANANEVIIHLTNHKDTLNIMVEDNGIGFNPKQITTKNKGMGIKSIDKRVAHLNGTMTIESETNKGTTIIIDLPL